MIEFNTCTERTARKEHACQDCRCAIYPGDLYLEMRWIYDGRWNQHKVCPPCVDLRNRQVRELNLTCELDVSFAVAEL